MRLSRLRGRKVNAALQRKGLVWKGKTMVIRWLAAAPRHPSVDVTKKAVYIGTIASTKLDKSAVRRNRMRRRCREAWRTVLLDDAVATKIPTLQLLIAPKSSSLDAPFSDIQSDVRTFLSTFHGR